VPRVKAIAGPQEQQGSGPWLTIPYAASFQHYGKRKSVPWIKLEAAWLADYRFQRLADHQKLALMCIWLLSARESRIPADPEYLQWRLALSTPVDLRGLVEGGWLELHGARVDQLPAVGMQRVVAPTAERELARRLLGGSAALRASPMVATAEPPPLVWPPAEEEERDDTAKQVEEWENRQPI
jgi:hypothetical protein